MSKPVLGLLIGGVLGILDGLSALVSAPEVAPQIASIVFGSTTKGLITGALIGWFAKKVGSLRLGIGFGLGVGVALAFVVSLLQKLTGQPAYYWQIMLPGGILGMIVGYATQRYGKARLPPPVS